MASSASTFMALLLSISLLLPSALAGVICEDLPQDLCAYAVSSSSKRCLLESYHRSGGRTEYQCKTSGVVVDRISDWIESDQCVKECGVDRNMVGISSDSLLEPHFTAKLCSSSCYQNCPNIIDLYFNLAAGEGVFLPDLCEVQRANPHRAMMELILSSSSAPGPVAAGGEVGKLEGQETAGLDAPVASPFASPVGSPLVASPFASPVASPSASPSASPVASPFASPAPSPSGYAPEDDAADTFF